MSVSSAETREAAAGRWIDRWVAAIGANDAASVVELLSGDGSWRDILAFSPDFRTLVGAEQLQGFVGEVDGAEVRNVSLVGELPNTVGAKLGYETHDWTFTFDTPVARCRGVIRLLLDDDKTHAPRALSLLTLAEELIGHEELAGPRRPRGTSDSRDFAADNWFDRRLEELRYLNSEPTVLIVGGGQAGLSTAARLKLLGIDALVIDKHPRVGDNWRNRYHSLTLHNEVWSNHLPYMPFPSSWPVYIPKDKLANWFESYADAMELNVWGDTSFVGADFDAVDKLWRATVRRADGSERILRPRHIVMATGVSGIPHVPHHPTLERFTGEILHSSDYTSGKRHVGKNALVVGTGNSAHDVAQDLQSHGAHVTMLQRSSTTVLSLEPSAQKYYALYEEGTPTETSDLINLSVSSPLLVELFKRITQEVLTLDRELLEGLAGVGFRTDIGEDLTGFQMKYFRRGGGYYINVGCSDLLVSRAIGLRQLAEVEEFGEDCVRFADGSHLPVDLVVLATGYQPIQELVRQQFGDSTAELVGPIWGLDDEGEMRGIARPTKQENLWFIAGGLFQCRVYSSFLALQIAAAEFGVPIGSARANPIDVTTPTQREATQR